MPAKQDLIYIDQDGFHPQNADISYFLEGYLIPQFLQIYGDDCYLGADTQDYQLLALFATGMLDTYRLAKAVYNSFSPQTATGEALSNNVAINGIKRAGATASRVSLTLTGVAGTVVTDGKAKDGRDYIWAINGSYTIGASGSVIADAVCETLGNVRAKANTITIIATPQLGWQGVTNVKDAIAGDDRMTDAEVRKLQRLAADGPKRTSLYAIISAIIKQDPQVATGRIKGFENPLDKQDTDGLPPHSFAIVIETGDSAKIGKAIAFAKSIGSTSVGNTTVTVPDPSPYTGNTTVKYYTMTKVKIAINVDIKSSALYDTDTDDIIASAIIKYINNLGIHEDVQRSKIFAPADLLNRPKVSRSFDIVDIKIAKDGSTPAEANVPIGLQEGATTNRGLIKIKHL